MIQSIADFYIAFNFLSRQSIMKRSVQEFHVLVERDEDGWLVASVPQLPGCHTQAKSYDTLMKRIRKAIEVWLDVSNELPEKSEFVGVQRVMV